MKGEDQKFQENVTKKFSTTDGGYARVTFPEMILLTENDILKILVDDGGELFTTAAGNILPVGNLSCITIFLVILFKRRQK